MENELIRADEDTSVVEWLEEPPGERADTGVRLSGDAARDVTDALGALVGIGYRAQERASAYYLVAPSDEVAKKLADGTLRWANTERGDASVLIKDAKSGQVATHGLLRKGGLGKVLGPVAWQAMAMATQQHYLVSIDRKLDGIQHGIEEVLARDEDDKLAELEQASASAQDAIAELLSGVNDSPQLRADAAENLRATSVVWRSLQRRAKRHADSYFLAEANADRSAGAPASEEAAQKMVASWGLLMYATRVLAQCSQVVTLLPYDDAATLERATQIQRRRIEEALTKVAALADQLAAGNAHWQAALEEWDGKRFKAGPAARDVLPLAAAGAIPNPLTTIPAFGFAGFNAVRHAAKLRHRRPDAALLPSAFVEDLAHLPRGHEPAPRMLVEVRADGDVVVSAVAKLEQPKEPIGTGWFAPAVPDIVEALHENVEGPPK